MPERLAIISDVHGNVWALEAVLADIAGREIWQIVNLGDCLYGPLRPGATADMLAGRKIATVCGNEDRLVVECGDGDAGDSTARFVRSELKKNQLEWLRTLPRTRSIGSDLYLFHGTPDDDTQYLLREVREKIVANRSAEQLENMLRGVDYAVILCGHDHLQGEARLPSGKLVLNPGSVGLPAYSENSPFPHIMAAGTPHARYSILTKSGSGWLPEHRAVEYDWDHAADVAAGRGRADWARWLRTGQA